MSHLPTPPELWFSTPQGIVSATPIGRPLADVEDEKRELAYYGGYLICESVPTQRIKDLIAAAPLLAGFVRDFKEYVDEAEKKVGDSGVVALQELIRRFYDRAWNLARLARPAEAEGEWRPHRQGGVG